MKITRRRTAAVLTAGLLGAGSLGLATTAASASDSQPLQHFILSGATASAGNQTFILYGPISEGGVENQSDAHDQYDVIRLAGGTFRVNHPDMKSTTKFRVDPQTCFAQFELAGRYTISNGTGKYQGISGKGNYQGTGSFVLKRTSSGACDQNSEPTTEIFNVHGQGPIHL